jgi:2'-5' RNA ligase
MRLFVAVEIEDTARRAAAAAAEELRHVLAPVLKARWVAAENMHLTVRFIGQVDDLRAPALVEALCPPLDIAPFDLELGACGVFPPRGAPRVLWIGLTQGLPSLALLHDAFNQRLRPFGFEPEVRPFSAHLTLARIKDAPGGAARAVRDALDRVTVHRARSDVGRATLFQSHLSTKGPRYEPVAFIPLRGARREPGRQL